MIEFLRGIRSWSKEGIIKEMDHEDAFAGTLPLATDEDGYVEFWTDGVEPGQPEHGDDGPLENWLFS